MSAQPLDKHEQRATCRLTLHAEGRLSEPYAGQHDVELIDISSTGARVATYRRYQPGQTLYLTVDQLRSIKCEARWSRPGEVGLAFERPLHVAILEHLAAAHRG